MSKNHSRRTQDTTLSTTGSGIRNLIHWLLAIAAVLVVMALAIDAFPNLHTDIERLLGGKERAIFVLVLVWFLSIYMLFRKEK